MWHGTRHERLLAGIAGRCGEKREPERAEFLGKAITDGSSLIEDPSAGDVAKERGGD